MKIHRNVDTFNSIMGMLRSKINVFVNKILVICSGFKCGEYRYKPLVHCLFKYNNNELKRLTFTESAF